MKKKVFRGLASLAVMFLATQANANQYLLTTTAYTFTSSIVVLKRCGEWQDYKKDDRVVGRWRQCDGYTQHQYYDTPKQ